MIPHRSEDWHPVAFILGCGLSIALLMSWILEPTRSLWLTLDDNFFWAVNDSLAWGRGWQVFWAVANNRAVDAVAALSFFGLFVHFIVRKGQERTEFLLAIGLMLTGLLIAAVQIAGGFGRSQEIKRIIVGPEIDVANQCRTVLQNNGVVAGTRLNGNSMSIDSASAYPCFDGPGINNYVVAVTGPDAYGLSIIDRGVL